jgi:hypothetical protein
MISLRVPTANHVPVFVAKSKSSTPLSGVRGSLQNESNARMEQVDATGFGQNADETLGASLGELLDHSARRRGAF